MTLRSAALGLLAVAMLAGCSNDGSGLGTLRASLASLGASRAAPVDPSSVVTPEFLAQQTEPLIYAELPDRGAQSGLTLVRRSGDVALWAAADGISVALERGVLTATRGLGGDLMSAELSEVQSAIRGQRSRAVRVMRYLDGEDQEVLRSFICDYARRSEPADTLAGRFPAIRVDEDCAGLDTQFVNTYWINGGIMRKSRQWVGPFVGFLTMERLVD